MEIGRREFTMSVSAVALLLWRLPGMLAGRLQKPEEPHPPRLGPQAAPGDEPTPPREAAKAILQENQKQIRKDIERLYQLAEELKKEVEKTDASVVLSLSVVRKAEEVEKLAKRIKNLARG